MSASDKTPGLHFPIVLGSQYDSEFPLPTSEEVNDPWWIPPDSYAEFTGSLKRELHNDTVIDTSLVKAEDEFDFSAFSSASQVDSLLKVEIEVSSNTTSVDKPTLSSDSALAYWQPTSELMHMILGEDSRVAGFDFRLDNDVYMAANKESALSIFPVITYILVLFLIVDAERKCFLGLRFNSI